MVIEYKVIDRGSGEFIPVVTADGVEIYRGAIHRTGVLAFLAAYDCPQVQLALGGADPRDVAR